MTMELSMTIALLAALLIGEFFTALIITVFVLVAEVLEGLTVNRGRRAIGDLLNLLPYSAWVVKDGTAIEVPVGGLHPGDRVLIRPGTRIPVDGRVVSGNSCVEEAAITGEPLPQDKLPGSRVFAGTLNQTGAIEVEAENLGRDTTFGRIVEAVEKRSRPELRFNGSRTALPVTWCTSLWQRVCHVAVHSQSPFATATERHAVLERLGISHMQQFFRTELYGVSRVR